MSQTVNFDDPAMNKAWGLLSKKRKYKLMATIAWELSCEMYALNNESLAERMLAKSGHLTKLEERS